MMIGEVDKTTGVSIERMEVNVYTFPTDSPESDGTLKWDSTTIVVVHVFAEGIYGLGYSYTVGGAAEIIRDHLSRHIIGQNAMDISACWTTMIQAIRNIGDTGVAMMAVSAIDGALWDLKAKLLKVPGAVIASGP
jgi:L-alanine-DL-glutamate epimerase-like enolase superfamily enzyme